MPISPLFRIVGSFPRSGHSITIAYKVRMNVMSCTCMYVRKNVVYNVAEEVKHKQVARVQIP